MKKIIFCICILICVSCKSNKSNNNGFDNIILGEWVLIEVSGGLCNACPEVIFKEDDKALLINYSEQPVEFYYKLLSNNKMNFNFGNNENYFDEEEFFYSIEIKNSVTELTIKSIKNSSNYILSKKD